MISEKLRELLDTKFLEKEFSDCFTVDISQNNTKIEVFIDSDSELDLRKCQKISRYLEAIIDEEGWVGEKYILEVSSPGARRPLVERQYPKHIGRKVKIKTTGEKYEGILSEVGEQNLTVQYIEIERIKKRKIKTEISKVIPFDDIKEIKVILSFK